VPFITDSLLLHLILLMLNKELSKRIKYIESSYEDKLNNLQIRYDQQKKELLQQKKQGSFLSLIYHLDIRQEKQATKNKLENKVDKLRQYLQMDGSVSNISATRMENDSFIANKLSDSMLRQSLNGSNLMDYRNGSLTNIQVNKGHFARRSSGSIEKDVNLFDKENICTNNGQFNSTRPETNNLTIRKLSGTFGGFTTLSQNSQNSKILDTVSQSLVNNQNAAYSTVDLK